MAIWHFKAYLVPLEELEGHCGCIPDSLPFPAFDDHRWWDRTCGINQVAASLTPLFGVPGQEGEGMWKWRVGPHSVIAYFESNGAVEVVAAEADARERCDEFLEALVRAAKSLNCIFYLSSFEVVLADALRLKESLRRSVAYRFLVDAEAALTDPTNLHFEHVPPERGENEQPGRLCSPHDLSAVPVSMTGTENLKKGDWRTDRILLLMDVFGKPCSSLRHVTTYDEVAQWRPCGEEETRAFADLVSEANRTLIKQWYQRHSSLNRTAESFRRILEHAIGESLPLGGGK